MKLDQILAKAEISDAVQFEQFLTDNNISNTWLDVCLTDYNQEYFNIVLDDYDHDVIFYNGVYEK